MKLTFEHDRVLAVMAHPDDAELLCAGTLARAKEDGAEIGICVMCRGDKGMAASGVMGELSEVRKREMSTAVGVLGSRLFWANCPDGELADCVNMRRCVVDIYRRFRPTLVLAHTMEDYHPDHRAASQIAEAASWFCASRGQITDSPPLSCAPALWWCDTIGMNQFIPSFYIDISTHFELKKRMLACHHSQLARQGDKDFAPLMEQMTAQCATRGAQSGVALAEAFRVHDAFKRVRAW